MPMGDSQPGDDSLFARTPNHAEAPWPPATGNADRSLRVSVPYTTHARTLAALRIVSQLGAGLDVRPRVLIFSTLPLTYGHLVPPGYLEGLIQALARESPLEFTVQVCLCRHAHESLRRLLPIHALVVIGGKRRWWPTTERLLAERLGKDGHEVIFVDWD